MTGLRLQVTLADQSLVVLDGTQVLHCYPVSSSRFGPGSMMGSFRTPLGRFRICEKLGDDADPFTIFRSRVPVGVWNPAQPVTDDLVLTRILRLEGLDEDNANTYERFIYIHGTNHEDSIGTPASQGCIRMNNRDLLQLYELIPVGTPVSVCLT